MITASPRIPGTLQEMLSPAWLAEALGPQFPGIQIQAVTTGPIVSRVATNLRFHVDGQTPDLDSSSLALCLKGMFTESGALLAGTGTHEAFFYRDLAAATGVRTLHAVYADVDPERDTGLIITDDVVAEGAVFLDALTPYTPDQAAESLAELARLHAATWRAPGLAEVDWLAPRMTSHLGHRGFPEIHGNFTGPIGAGVPAEVRDAARLVEAYRRLAAAVEVAEPWCVIHGDPHVGNLYLDAAGRPSFLDWQLVQRGPWYVDVGYHLASALSVADRRRHEDDLLRHYLERLRAGGVDAPAFEDAQAGIRRGVVAGFFLWGITLKVKPAITTELLTRIGTAVADWDSLARTLADPD
ncbi:phosphotransferase [Pseudofrankia inefficax]|uniref:Aminoglycoside phosphotransferase n=1 Tax=Pseudofrankia inefficax (strain DSM 45817 / CECT 9037 / DDB 130130 / EuI1c) TaxID=298654 RepID=E3IUA6_PSEI1|nr:phosphotransferase [Pseudofrankia inefficax]ADP82443.1 aminoglycoside phosphotransferase [Pseudofrankia inefficax]